MCRRTILVETRFSVGFDTFFSNFHSTFQKMIASTTLLKQQSCPSFAVLYLSRQSRKLSRKSVYYGICESGENQNHFFYSRFLPHPLFTLISDSFQNFVYKVLDLFINLWIMDFMVAYLWTIHFSKKKRWKSKLENILPRVTFVIADLKFERQRCLTIMTAPKAPKFHGLTSAFFITSS